MQSDKELLKHKERILKHTTDGEKGFNAYLDSLHVNIITDNAICLYVIEDDYIVLYYMEAFNKRGNRESRRNILFLYDTYTKDKEMAILYTGKTNIGSSNSIEIKPNVWQFIPR